MKLHPLSYGFDWQERKLDLTHDLLGPDVRLYWEQISSEGPGGGWPVARAPRSR